MTQTQILVLVVLGSAMLSGASLLGVTIPPPSPWLLEWTGWIATVVGTVVASRVLWMGATALHRLIK